ncbi:MAG TPA: hypothetical protein VFX89_21305 [Gammaproteobacteria bacterium]|nr:hypothetical protein [Gammaproteobacteria bacterium]
MTRSKIVLALMAGAALLPAASFGQPPPVPPAPPADTMLFIGNGAPIVPFGGRIDVVRSEGSVLGKVVKDKPYSADSVTESTQILADGNRITSRNEARFYRDAAGRTRSEQKLGAVGPWQTGGDPVTLITINDPVADVGYSLNTADQTAWKFRPFKLVAGEVGTVATAAAATGPLPANLPAPPPGAATFALRVEAPSAQADGAPPERFELHATAPASPAGAGLRTYTPGFAVSGVARVDAGAVATEDLGEQVLEGVLAHGTRHTQTIAAGAIGNERPIEIVAEEWYSADIEAVVQRRNFDPRFGETIYRLVNLSRSEQSPDLFAVPSGYTIRGDGEPGTRFSIAGTEERDAGGRAERRVFLVQPKEATPTK